MARRLRPETAVAVVGIRALQVAKDRERLARLPDLEAFAHEYAQLRERIITLGAGGEVWVQAWELADELLSVAGLKSRFDQSGPNVFRFVGDALVPEDYARVGL